MDFASFRESLARPEPPEGLSLALQALWWDAKGDWEKAHQCAQECEDEPGMWCMPISTARRAISRMPVIGTAAAARQRRKPGSMKRGKAWCGHSWRGLKKGRRRFRREMRGIAEASPNPLRGGRSGSFGRPRVMLVATHHLPAAAPCRNGAGAPALQQPCHALIDGKAVTSHFRLDLA